MDSALTPPSHFTTLPLGHTKNIVNNMKITKHCIEHNDEEISITVEWHFETVDTDTDRGTWSQEFSEPTEITLDSTGETWEFDNDPEPGTWQDSVLDAIIFNRIDCI